MAANVELGKVRKRNIALRVTLYIGAALIGLVALVLLINLYDPALDPDAAAAMNAAPSLAPDKENAYFVLYGLGVAEGQDPHAHGMRFVTENNAWMRSVEAGKPIDRRDVEAMAKQSETIKWHGVTKDLCGEQRDDCLSSYVRNRAQIDKLARDNRVRLARYRSLYRYKNFSETSLNRIHLNWLPSYTGTEHETVIAQIALKAADGDVLGALRDLTNDTEYWRRVLAGASTLISKSIASNFLIRNYALASQIVARHRDRPGVMAHLAGMLKPFTSEEKDYKKAFSGEFQWGAHMYATLHNQQSEYGFFTGESRLWDRAASSMLYKPNATINLQHQWAVRMQALTDVPAHSLAETVQQIDGEFSKFTNPFRVDMGYNPVGKILVAIGASSPQSHARYIGRVHNLDGYMRLLRMQLDIYGKKVPVKDIGSHLENSPADLFDPYRNQPFRWDPDKRELWFEGINPKGKDTLDHQRIGVHI